MRLLNLLPAVAGFACAALLVSGCSAGSTPPTDGSPAATSASPSPASPASAEPSEPVSTTIVEATPTPTLSGQAWADEKIQIWLEVAGVSTVPGLLEPFSWIKSWESSEPGHLVLHVDPVISQGDDVYHQNLGPANDLWLIPAVMIEQTWDQNRDLEVITAVTTDGAREESYSREEKMGPKASGENEPGTQAWADELVHLWLEAEGVRSVKGLLHPYSLIASWSATDDDQITFVVHPSITEVDEIHNENLGPANELWMITALMMQRLYCRVPELDSIVATTSDGARTEIITREDHGQDDCWT